MGQLVFKSGIAVLCIHNDLLGGHIVHERGSHALFSSGNA